MKNDIRRIAKHTRTQLFGVRGVTDDIKAQWDSAIADFQAKRAQLSQLETQLYQLQGQAAYSDDYEGWNIALNKVLNAESVMDSVAGAVSAAADYWASAKNTAVDFYNDISGSSDIDPNTYYGGLFGVSSKRKLKGLGLAPFAAIPISLVVLAGVIATAVTAIAAATSYISYLSVGGKGKSPLAQISDTAMYVMIAALAVFVLPKLLNR